MERGCCKSNGTQLPEGTSYTMVFAKSVGI